MTGTAPPTAVIAPGARVVIRDAEWVVRRVDHSSDGGHQLTCDGISELVRDREAIFLTSIDKDVKVLDPAKTKLIPDVSPGYQASLLYLESLLRQVAPSDEHVHVGHRAAMDAVPYQLDPAVQALRQPRQRILIADAVGLGKTLEAGILVSELIKRGRGKRILVLAIKSMLTQFQKEFWSRFTIPLTRLDSIGLQRVRSRIPTNHNPFYYYDKAIISIDTLKQDAEYRTYLEKAYWDIIVIDEAHNVADRGTGSQRSRLARLLARRSDTLIMLSATPHDGRARSFASLMNMLDATAIADPEHYSSEDFRDKGLVVRRFKKDIQRQVAQAFKDRRVHRYGHDAGPQEEAAYQALLEVRVTPKTSDGSTKANRRDLFLVSLEKALFSSPAACIRSIDERMRKVVRKQENEGGRRFQEEVDSLVYLKQLLERVTPASYAKYQALLRAVRGGEPFHWNSGNTDDRLVIFTERIETMRFLAEHLAKDLKLKKGQLEVLHGGMSDIDQQAVVEAFGKPDAKVRVLVCSDVAAEGINLHYLSHRLIHFDIPWSLMVFQQRNGRVDRYGQTKTPEIVYLITRSANPTIRGDMRILEVLETKDEQAYENIGDPSAFMNVHDVEEEEKITAAAIAEGQDAKAFDTEHQPRDDEGEDLLKLFLGEGAAAPEEIDHEAALVEEPLSLYDDDFSYCVAALNHLNRDGTRVQFTFDKGERLVAVTAPEDLQHRFGYFPREVMPENWEFVLSPDKGVIDAEIKRSRGDETAWPKVHYLWPLNPVLEWLNERMLAAFGRHEAPVIRMSRGLPTGQTVFVVSGLVPNRKSHPLVQAWLGVVFESGNFSRVEPFRNLLERTGFARGPLPNPSQDTDLGPLQALLPAAVEQARAWMIDRRDGFERDMRARLERQVDELERLRNRQVEQLELKLGESRQAEAFKRHRERRGLLDINEVFDEYRDWVRDTMTTERHPYLQVVAVLAGES